MAKQTIGLGTPPAGTDGDTVRTAFDKANKNFTELYDGAQADAAARVGSIVFFARNTAPAGYLKANGAAVSRTTFAALFAAIGTTFGAGNGSTTFNVPDLRGEFPRGWDDGRGVDSGRAFGSAQADMLKAHSHITRNVRTGATNGASWIVGGDQTNADYSTDVTGGAETRPRNVALLACIKH